MTFLPQVLSKIDDNNSASNVTTWSGVGTNTTGYISIILSISSTANSNAGGIQVQFSDDNSTWTTYYTDSYISPGLFTKSYPILKKYWRLQYTSSTTSTITSRLSTDASSNNANSLNSFNNTVESAIDAFGKLRVSNPFTLLDLRFPGQSTGSNEFLDNRQQVCYFNSGATATVTRGNAQLTYSLSNAGTYVSQSRNFCTYQPGKSMLILISVILDADDNSSGTVTRAGYFNYDSTIPGIKNGLFFQYTAGSGCAIVYISNTANVTTISQSNWNIDKMDGTGTSGLNLDFKKAQLLIIDFEWLGVGRIRFGFYAFGRITYCHEVTNINALIGPYLQSINLPICTMMTCLSGGSGALTQVCATVISEGGYNPTGRPFAISSPSSVAVGASETFLLALRGGGDGTTPNTNYYHQTIVPYLLGVSSEGSSDFFIFRTRVYRDGDSYYTGGTVTWSNVNATNSVAQYGVATGGSLVVGSSVVVNLNYAFGKGINSLDSLTNVFNASVLNLTSNISNVATVLVITCQKVSTGTVNAYAQIAWQEVY